VIVLLMWLYLSAVVILLGAEIDAIREESAGVGRSPAAEMSVDPAAGLEGDPPRGATRV
jgi:uncharacterized BrkB/YihY/UPF0761 family membrane protein